MAHGKFHCEAGIYSCAIWYSNPYWIDQVFKSKMNKTMQNHIQNV
jgi:hypothetical protein